MNLQELIQKNNEELSIKLYNFGRLSDRQELSDMQEEIQEDIEEQKQSLLNNILEYIEGEKITEATHSVAEHTGFDNDMLKACNCDEEFIEGHNQALQLIADYIKGDNK